MVVLYWSCERIVDSISASAARGALAGSSCTWNSARPDAVAQIRSPARLRSRKPPGTPTRALKSSKPSTTRAMRSRMRR